MRPYRVTVEEGFGNLKTPEASQGEGRWHVMEGVRREDPRGSEVILKAVGSLLRLTWMDGSCEL